MDADTLFRQGVIAIRDQRDLKRGHALLTQALQLNPHNEMAWLWLTRTVRDPAQRLEYVERALQINPASPPAQQLKAKLQAALRPAPPPSKSVIVPLASPPTSPTLSTPATLPTPELPAVAGKTVEIPVTKAEKERIVQLMDRAETYLQAGDIESAIQQWIEVLSIRVDHEEALAKASAHLWRMHYHDDARELIGRAVLAGTRIPTIYMTAIDMAERQGDYAEAEALREHIARLPDADEQLLVTVVDYYDKRVQIEQAVQFIEQALEVNPHRQKLLLRLGHIFEDLNRPEAAMAYYDRAVRLGMRTPEGKEADRRLTRAVPVITDRERGSVVMALRETVGFMLIFLVMAWHDAGLNLLDLGPRRWVGVLLGFLGGYLLITATSSPQQRPLAAWLGGQLPSDAGEAKHEEPHLKPGQAKPDPTELPIIATDTRAMLGAVGIAILSLALWLVFYRSIGIIMDYPLPYMPW